MESQIIYGDCIEEMRDIPDKSIDLIITDPPYFLPALHYQTRREFRRNFGDLGVMEGFFKEVFKQFNRILKEEGTMYIFCDGQSYPLFYYHLYPMCKSVRPLIWDKGTSINGYSWRHQHEIIIFAEMPKAKPVPSGDGDILKCGVIKVDNREHPAQKPTKLLKQFIAKSSKIGDMILDPFAGSGSVLRACLSSQRNYIMIEKEEKYYTMMIERAKRPTQETLQGGKLIPLNDDGGTNFTKSSADDFPTESLIGVKRESDDSPNSPHDSLKIKEEANFS